MNDEDIKNLVMEWYFNQSGKDAWNSEELKLLIDLAKYVYNFTQGQH
jgi:hypothetical protein